MTTDRERRQTDRQTDMYHMQRWSSPSKQPTAYTGSVRREKKFLVFFLFPSAYLILFYTIWLTSKLTRTPHFEERTNHRRLFKIICFFYFRLHKQGVFESGWQFILKSAYDAGGGFYLAFGEGIWKHRGCFFYFLKLFRFYSKAWKRGGRILSGSQEER